MSFLCVATDGWRLPRPDRDRRLKLTAPLPEKEPNGVHHALLLGAASALCGYPVRDLIVFSTIGFGASRRGDRCPRCDALAAHPSKGATDHDEALS